MKILVTGAGGFIGSTLVPKLLAQNHHVIALDCFFFGEDKLPTHDNLTLLKKDVRDIALEDFQGVEAVIDLVAISNDPGGEHFSEATLAINFEGRVNVATLAKKAGAKRYILPSSCSIYGFSEEIVSETSKTNPLTTYARANECAEHGVLPLASDDFTVTVIRQSTVYGPSPRMRFDVVVNIMTHAAWAFGYLRLDGDGKQYRPLVHVQDTTDVMCLLLNADPKLINGELYNVGGNACNYQIWEIADIVSRQVKAVTGRDVEIIKRGAIDNRSYRANFDKIEKDLGWTPKHSIEDAVHAIVTQLDNKQLVKTTQSVTLDWYKEINAFA